MEREVIQVTVPGLSDTEEVQVIVHDKIIQNGCFIVKGMSVMGSKLEDVFHVVCYGGVGRGCVRIV